VLCVARNSVYKSLEGVDAYDIDRDARSFSSSLPIVGHPPCRSWSAFCSHQAKPLPGEKELGPFVFELLKRNGGILEHPAHSRLWDFVGAPKPGQQERDGVWSLAVQQCWWGDCRSKNTWLMFFKIKPEQVATPMRLHNPQGDRRRWQLMSRHQRSATPIELARWLVDTARLVQNY
jgi:hypothetical protein